MKICIVSTTNIKHMTLVSMYTSILESNNISYDIIYLDRYGIKEDIQAKTIYRFERIFSANDIRATKIIKFIDFKKYAENIINLNNYDLIIIWNTLTALLLSKTLVKNKGKYILNIRDYYFDNNKLIRFWHGNLINNSLMTTISSKGFLKFLPKHNYVFVNSLNENIVNIEKKSVAKKEDFNVNHNSINIGFIGNIRFFDEQKKFINALKNDDRFNLWYSGTNGEPLEDFVRRSEITNCKFTGEFAPSETLNLMNNFDIVNNVFGNDTEDVRTLTPIRLYYAVAMNKPIITNNETFLGELIEEKSLGLKIDLDNPSIADEIYSYYQNINTKEFISNCEAFLTETLKENELFKREFVKILLNLSEENI